MNLMYVWTGGNPDSNTLISDMTTVICLDDYHSLDRAGRKKESVTALDPKAQNFDLMYQQIKDLKDGKTVAKPIYNHVSGLLDPPEDTSAPRVRPSCHLSHSCRAATIMPVLSLVVVYWFFTAVSAGIGLCRFASEGSHSPPYKLKLSGPSALHS